MNVGFHVSRTIGDLLLFPLDVTSSQTPPGHPPPGETLRLFMSCCISEGKQRSDSLWPLMLHIHSQACRTGGGDERPRAVALHDMNYRFSFTEKGRAGGNYKMLHMIWFIQDLQYSMYSRSTSGFQEVNSKASSTRGDSSLSFLTRLKFFNMNQISCSTGGLQFDKLTFPLFPSHS